MSNDLEEIRDEEPGGVGPEKFFCPHCAAGDPAYAWTFNRKELGLLGIAEYVTISCAAELSEAGKKLHGREICGRILSVCMLNFEPSSALIQQARARGFKA
jgi:hypothetical protein